MNNTISNADAYDRFTKLVESARMRNRGLTHSVKTNRPTAHPEAAGQTTRSRPVAPAARLSSPYRAAKSSGPRTPVVGTRFDAYA